MSAEPYSVRSRRGLSSLLAGLGLMLLSVCMLAGALLMNRLDETGVRLLPSPVAALSPTPFLPTLTPTLQPTVPPPTTELPSVTETAVPAATAPFPTSLPATATATPCSQPAGWVIYVVQRGDTLSSLARKTGTTTAALMQANCLSTSAIYAGQRLYLPSHPSPTLPYRCGPPLDWIIYYVQPGETLFSLARYFGVSVEDIRLANCMTGYTIYVGQPLYLPPLPPMPVPTFTPTTLPTAAPAPPAPPGPQPTNTPVPPSTNTPVPPSTSTPVPPTATLPPLPTSTYMPSPIETPTPPATPTDTLTPTP